MSYIILRLYSFECDTCGVSEDVLPSQGTRLRGALKMLRHSGWTVKDGKHYCPRHTDGD